MTFWAALWWEFVIFFFNRDTTITNSTEMTASTLVALFLLRLNRILRKYQSLENQTWPTSIQPGWSNGMKYLSACSEFTELHSKPRLRQIMHQNNQQNWKKHPGTYDIHIGESLVMFCKRKDFDGLNISDLVFNQLFPWTPWRCRCFCQP